MMTITALQDDYRTKKKSPTEVIEKLFSAIKKANPTFNAYLPRLE